MADLTTGQVAVTATPAVIIPYDLGGRQVQIKNIGTVTVFIGGANVTATNGYPVAPGEAPYPIPVNNPIWGVTASGAGSVAWADANN